VPFLTEARGMTAVPLKTEPLSTRCGAMQRTGASPSGFGLSRKRGFGHTFKGTNSKSKIKVMAFLRMGKRFINLFFQFGWISKIMF